MKNSSLPHLTSCPKCWSVMTAVTVDELTVDRCNNCGGIWFDLREHDKLRGRPHADRIDLGDRSSGERLDDTRDINCLRCGVRMVKLAFPDQPHIRYEQCATCGGAFLDAGEFTDLTRLTAGERLKTWWGRRPRRRTTG